MLSLSYDKYTMYVFANGDEVNVTIEFEPYIYTLRSNRCTLTLPLWPAGVIYSAISKRLTSNELKSDFNNFSQNARNTIHDARKVYAFYVRDLNVATRYGYIQ